MKKIICLFIILISIITISSCVYEEATNEIIIKVEDNVLVWNEYEGAISYNIYIDNMLTDTVYENSYQLKLKEGTYKIKVNAKTSTSYTGFSNIVEYISDGSNYQEEIVKLEKPYIRLMDDVLTWNKILNAEAYEIYKNDELLTITSIL